MNKHIPIGAPLPISAGAGPTGEAGAPNLPTYRVSPRCPDCGAGDLSYRVIDEDTGCSYPVDDGEHYCRHCDAVWADEDVFPEVAARVESDLRFTIEMQRKDAA